MERVDCTNIENIEVKFDEYEVLYQKITTLSGTLTATVPSIVSAWMKPYSTIW